MKINRYEPRLKGLQFTLLFEERFSELDRDVNAVIAASIALQNSDTWPKILELIIVVGNFMNGAGFRGGARAFKITSINKLMDTKSADNQSTLLHFLAGVIEQNFPDLLKFQEEFKHVTAASRVALGEVTSEVTDMKRQLDDLQTELDLHFSKEKENEEKDNKEDKFAEMMRPFLERNQQKFSDLEKRFEQMKKAFEDTVLLFGEEIKGASPEEFFGIFKTFMTSFDRVFKDNTKIREKEKKAADKKEREEKDKLRKEEKRMKAKENNAMRQSSAHDEKGMMDKLLATLRTGTELDVPKRRKDRLGVSSEERRRSRLSISARTIEMLSKMNEGVPKQ